MVLATDLRVGNILKTKRGVATLCEIMADHLNITSAYLKFFVDDSIPWNEYLEEVSGIVLNPEILYNCGFIKVDEVYWEYDRFTFILEHNYISLTENKRQYFGTKPVNYLHQLQNLFYALTGDEIEYKEHI